MSTLREELTQEIIDNFAKGVAKKKYLGGVILTREEADASIKAGSITAHTIDLKDGTSIEYFTNNHIFGYELLPIPFTSCSMSFPMQVTPRKGFEKPRIESIDDYLKVFKGSKQIWSFKSLVDIIVNEKMAEFE